ncbi:hypothetical protein RDI58_011871 [Solanum bulbocastanum]|uniref:Uncharacterized protein n=1 Tax=Solanum bulbocastanum TaxID=147425 RepID=A0AAN8YHG0_SOLBU
MLQTEQSNAKIEASIQENNNNNYNTSSASCDHETETRRDHKSISEGNNASNFRYQVTIHRRNHSQEAEKSTHQMRDQRICRIPKGCQSY